MAKAGINTGTTPNDGNGDTLLSGAIKINQNFTEIYNILGTGTSLNTIGIGGTVISINSNSFVGIGTTNSTSKLAVNGNTSLEDLNVSGVSTFAGITTVTGETLFAKQLNVSGVSTFINNVTFNNNISITASSSGDLLRLTQTGTGNALFVEDETTPNSTPFVINNAGSVGVGTTLPLAKLHVVGSILTSGLNASIGYSNGSGGSVTQSTSKTTSVTLNSSTGLIITSNSTINAGLTSSFTFTNSRIEVNDLLLVSHVSGGTLASYTIAAVPSNGSAIVYVRNNSSSNLAEALTLRFAIIKSTNS